jgi:REP element-mobilizing transposase RayT
MTDHNFKPKLSRDDFGWYNKRRLPHLDADVYSQFVTFRLSDSMPEEVLERWRKEGMGDAAFRKRIEHYLDAGYGECWLDRPDVAKIVREALYFHHNKNYFLDSWVLMPNHAHILFTPLAGVHLPVLMHSIKSYSAQMANKILGRQGQFWQHESFDRYIRDTRHFAAVRRYIEHNPVKAGLCKRPEEWRFSSAYENSINI